MSVMPVWPFLAALLYWVTSSCITMVTQANNQVMINNIKQNFMCVCVKQYIKILFLIYCSLDFSLYLKSVQRQTRLHCMFILVCSQR